MKLTSVEDFYSFLFLLHQIGIRASGGKFQAGSKKCSLEEIVKSQMILEHKVDAISKELRNVLGDMTKNLINRGYITVGDRGAHGFLMGMRGCRKAPQHVQLA